ncbi:hypothetical protein F0U44_06815 [Nocardioides humilatus]|uniref:Lipoprotein n=1 Tax=Nocardioides humilatus TaxID=2607660 RepID=A0A5B1LN66_9ACTN|nr:hypothetical protein [Nocardioides humilatus]KAA1421964.1 hypothetical protein F0U44_06815 [Nocardioides humilatus]
MTLLPRHAATLGATALFALSLSACGGPPDDASVADFCKAIHDTSWATSLDETSDGDEIVKALQKWRDKLDETGTPKGIPDDARKGFEITIDTLSDVKAEDFDSPDDLGDINGDLSKEDEDKVEALNDYSTDKCEGG